MSGPQIQDSALESRARVASPFRGVDLDGDKLDNLDEWYAAPHAKMEMSLLLDS